MIGRSVPARRNNPRLRSIPLAASIQKKQIQFLIAVLKEMQDWIFCVFYRLAKWRWNLKILRKAIKLPSLGATGCKKFPLGETFSWSCCNIFVRSFWPRSSFCACLGVCSTFSRFYQQLWLPNPHTVLEENFNAPMPQWLRGQTLHTKSLWRLIVSCSEKTVFQSFTEKCERDVSELSELCIQGFVVIWQTCWHVWSTWNQ